jgi:succinate dehydrogenase/fumarate reductase flavoprotein subunit
MVTTPLGSAEVKVDPRTWDSEFDVIVAGYGYSGAMAAIAAAKAGATVALIEKMPRPGGNSILSGGSCIFGTDYEETLAYLRATCDDATDDEVLVAQARGMVDLPDLMEPLVQAAGFGMVYLDRAEGAYPFRGGRQLRAMRVTRNERFSGFDYVTGGRAGQALFAVCQANVELDPKIEVFLSTNVERLIRENDQVVGCEVASDGTTRRVAARRAVVLCTGGFEHNRRLLRHYFGPVDFSSASPTGSTGDGILMGQEVGAALWHMWHLHGSYGFRLANVALGIRHAFVGPRDRERGPMPWIIVDQRGRRFMNEYPPAPQDTPIRELVQFDPDSLTYPRVPAYLIFDENGRKLGPIGRPVMNEPSLAYEWSEDNLAEVASGDIKTSDSVMGLAEQAGLPSETLQQAITDWNEASDAGRDQFGRPDWSMLRIEASPLYIVPVYPIITNTQGGLVHDAEQRVLDPFGRPIHRLYKAGENGSIYGHLYLLGGNNTECLVGGWIAGTNAAQEVARS